MTKNTKPRPPGANPAANPTSGNRRRARWPAIAGVLGVLALGIAFFPWSKPTPPTLPGSAAATGNTPAAASYVADESCAQCHATAASAWQGSHHDQAMMHASEQSVRGDFANAVFKRPGETTRFFRRDGKFYVNTPGADGKAQDFEIKYTFGVAPLQQYLVEFPGGRLQALPLAWDTQKRRWFHLYPDSRPAGDDPLHWTGRYQNWNTMCAECHSTNLRKGYDAKNDSYDTRWDLINVSCQSCHGPGSLHLAWAERQRDGKAAPEKLPHDGLSVDFRSGDSRYQVDACGACHARRLRLSDGEAPGSPFLDNFRPELLRAGLYHADGQQLDEVYVYGSMLQSRMYQRGVRCTDCHDAHSLKLKAEGNAVCTQCHNAAGNPRFPTLKTRTYDSPEHHFHPVGGDGAQCVSCHMPSRNYMVVHARPDHSFRIPRPDQSERLGTPNACNQCHAQQPASWAAAAIAKWYGPERRQEPGFAPAFAAARAGRREAAPELIAIIRDPAQPAIVRASALQLLPLSSEAALAAAIEARHDGEGLVRVAAVEALSGQPPQQRAFLLAPLLRDPLRLVRIESARALATLPPGSLPDRERAAYDAAFAEFMQAQAAAADMPANNLGMANLHSLRGEDAQARELYTRTLKMDPYLAPARNALASHLSGNGERAAAESVLREGIRRNPNDGSLHYSLGLLLAESGQLAAAARELGTASRLLPTDARAAYNHGLALQQLGKLRDAEAALRKACTVAPDDPAHAYALAVLLMRDGRPQAALPYAERFAELDPGNPQASRLLAALRHGQPGNGSQNRPAASAK